MTAFLKFTLSKSTRVNERQTRKIESVTVDKGFAVRTDNALLPGWKRRLVDILTLKNMVNSVIGELFVRRKSLHT